MLMFNVALRCKPGGKAEMLVWEISKLVNAVQLDKDAGRTERFELLVHFKISNFVSVPMDSGKEVKEPRNANSSRLTKLEMASGISVISDRVISLNCVWSSLLRSASSSN